MQTAEHGHNVAKSSSKKPDRERLDMRLDPEMRDRAERQRTRFGTSLSAYIRQALIEKLERDESTDPALMSTKRKASP